MLLFLFCSRWLNTTVLIFVPKNMLPVPLRQDGGGNVSSAEEPVPTQRPALIVLLATRAAPGTVRLRLGRGTSGPFVLG